MTRLSLATDTSRLAAARQAPPSRLASALTLTAMSLGFGVVQLDVTIVNTALASIRSALGGGVAELQWVVNAYTIAFAAFILTAGALGDRLGARRIFMGGFALFTLASIGCGLAPDARRHLDRAVLLGVAIAIAAGVAFVWQEARTRQPMLPLILFRNRLFALCALVGLLANVSIYGLIFVFSLYFQEINHLSAFATGACLCAHARCRVPGQSGRAWPSGSGHAPPSRSVQRCRRCLAWRCCGLRRERLIGRSVCS